MNEPDIRPRPATAAGAIEASAPLVADDAVGVPRWYVAVVNNNSERIVAERLTTLGHEAYVAVQKRMRVRANGRKVLVDVVVIPSFVFVHCTEKVRRQVVSLPYVKRFLSDRARAVDGLAAPAAVIPEREMNKLRFMLGQSDYQVDFIEPRFRAGDSVRVMRGALRGLEGKVIRVMPPSGAKARKSAASDAPVQIVVALDILGAARLEIPSCDIKAL